ncbi:MAG: type II secretion system protein [Tepidisphaerales bacterium]
MPNICPSRGRRRAFTLVEILIVVIILGILAAIVVPQFASASTDSRNSVVARNLQSLAEQFLLYEARHGVFPEDAYPGQLPPGMAGMVDPAFFAQPTPIGGQWDWDFNQFGVQAAISIHLPARTAIEMAAIDRLIDDGDLQTGRFRADNDRYLFVIRQ